MREGIRGPGQQSTKTKQLTKALQREQHAWAGFNTCSPSWRLGEPNLATDYILETSTGDHTGTAFELYIAVAIVSLVNSCSECILYHSTESEIFCNIHYLQTGNFISNITVSICKISKEPRQNTGLWLVPNKIPKPDSLSQQNPGILLSRLGSNTILKINCTNVTFKDNPKITFKSSCPEQDKSFEES